MTRTSPTVATLTFSGNAIAHANINDVTNLTITWLDGAFVNTAVASNVIGYINSSGIVDFNDPVAGGGVASTIVTDNGKECIPLLTKTKSIILGWANDPEEVKKIETFLNNTEGEKLQVNGIYETADMLAVRRFQQKYFNDIIKPAGALSTTGIVGLYTRGKINVLNCHSTVQCPHFSTDQRLGSRGVNVGKIQNFLSILIGVRITTPGVFDRVTYSAVKRYQTIYSRTILKPLNLKSATGIWHRKSRAVGNGMLNCR